MASTTAALFDLEYENAIKNGASADLCNYFDTLFSTEPNDETRECHARLGYYLQERDQKLTKVLRPYSVFNQFLDLSNRYIKDTVDPCVVSLYKNLYPRLSLVSLNFQYYSWFDEIFVKPTFFSKLDKFIDSFINLESWKTIFTIKYRKINLEREFNEFVFKRNKQNFQEVLAVINNSTSDAEITDELQSIALRCCSHFQIISHTYQVIDEYLHWVDATSRYAQNLLNIKISSTQKEQIQILRTSAISALTGKVHSVINLETNIANNQLTVFMNKLALEEHAKSIYYIISNSNDLWCPSIYHNTLNALQLEASHVDVNADCGLKQSLHQPIAKYLQEDAQEKTADLETIEAATSFKATENAHSHEQVFLTANNQLSPLALPSGK